MSPNATLIWTCVIVLALCVAALYFLVRWSKREAARREACYAERCAGDVEPCTACGCSGDTSCEECARLRELVASQAERLRIMGDSCNREAARRVAFLDLARAVVRVDHEAITPGMLVREFPRLRGLADDCLAMVEEQQREPVA